MDLLECHPILTRDTSFDSAPTGRCREALSFFLLLFAPSDRIFFWLCREGSRAGRVRVGRSRHTAGSTARELACVQEVSRWVQQNLESGRGRTVAPQEARVEGRRAGGGCGGRAVAIPVVASAGSTVGQYQQTNLISDIPGVARITDPNLVNP